MIFSEASEVISEISNKKVWGVLIYKPLKSKYL